MTSLVIMVSPFIIGVGINLQKTIEDTYKRKLRRIIDNLDEHVIILGFGELGKKTLREVLRITGMGKPENSSPYHPTASNLTSSILDKNLGRMHVLYGYIYYFPILRFYVFP